MKRITLILLTVLVVVYVTLSLLGDVGDYKAEKLFYKAMRTYSKIVANPDVAPPAMLKSVEIDLNTLLKKYPNAAIAKTANISLAELYVTNKRYDDAMSVISSVMSKYKYDVRVMSMVQFMKGTIYEKMKEWDKALVEFKILRDKYFNTQLGLQIPLYIGKYYELKGDEALSRDAYLEAVDFYKKVERANSGNLPGYMTSMLLIQAYSSLKDYESAGARLEETLIKYPSPQSYHQLLPLVEKIYVEKLDSPERAIALYEKAGAVVKGGKMKNMIDKRIEILKKIIAEKVKA